MTDPAPLLTLAEALRLHFARPPHVATAFRWSDHGVLNKRGQRVKLRTVRIGGRKYTTEQDVKNFIAALNEVDDDDSREVDDDTRRSREAREALRGLGV